MVKALFDTNILIDYLNNIPEARQELNRYEDGAISIITWTEVMVGAPDPARSGTKAFLSRFEIVGLDDQVAEAAVALRQTHRMRLPDAVIWASARTRGLLLVTRDNKDFAGDDPGVRIPYSLA